MRVTNKMMTNNTMYNINKNKINLSKLDEQYSTGKKIQRPSDDPVIAVRALKLRTNLSELNQYYEKNIPDAKSWMEVTEGSLKKINEILTKINSQCVDGSSEDLTVTERNSIVENLKEMKNDIYQEGNSNYAGRYVFTGYKTDTSLIFNEESTDMKYEIQEQFGGSDIQKITSVVGGYKVSDFNDTSTEDDFVGKSPNLVEAYRIRLSYDNLDKLTDEQLNNMFKYTEAGVEKNIPVKSIDASDANAYNPAAGTVNFIPETGELIFGKDTYENLRLQEDGQITVDYEKTKFSKGELRPEHYFSCKVTDVNHPAEGTTLYVQKDQEIKYEINFNQKLTINTEGKDAIKHSIGRDIDEILSAVNAVIETENKISEVNKLLERPGNTAVQTAALNQLKEQLETEKVLKDRVLTEKFEKGITGSSTYQNELNVTTANLGSRYKRLELTESRLDSQQVDFEDLLSKNEDADIVDTYIKLTSAETIYNASLSSAAKIVRNSLLDFI